MKQTKVIRKRDKRRNQSKRMNKRRNQSKRIDKSKRRNKTKKLRGGLWPFSSSDNKITSLSDGADYQENNASDLAEGMKQATNISGAVISALGVSGVGLPLAGALTATLIVAKLMTKMVIMNKKLIAALLDVLNIVTHCDKLNATMNFILQVFNKKILELNTIPKLEIDAEVKKRLEKKLTKILTFLVNLSTNEILDVLKNDPKLKNSGVEDIVKAEMAKRKEDGILTRVKNTSMRVIDRTVNAESKINEILRELTMINGYFMLMKSQFDMIIQRYERLLSNDEKQNIWLEIETKNIGDDKIDINKYNNYLSLNTTTELSEIEKKETNTVGVDDTKTDTVSVDDTKTVTKTDTVGVDDIKVI